MPTYNRPKKSLKAKKKKQNQPAAPSQGKKTAPKQNNRKSVQISGCTGLYARSLANPFTGPEGACVPVKPALMTRRMKCWAQFTVTTGTAGIGFVYADPRVFVTNDLTSVFYSTAAYAGTTFVPTPAVGVLAASSNSEYASTFFGPPGGGTGSYRCVSFGIRVRYTGTELNRGGQYFSLQEPNHSSLTNNDQVLVAGYEEHRKLPISFDRWSNVLYKPVDESDYSMRRTFPNTVLATDTDSYYVGTLLVAPNSTPAVNLTAEVEVMGHYEVMGPFARGKKPSHVDTNGFDAVHSASLFGQHLLPSQGDLAPASERLLRDAGKYLSNGISWAFDNPDKVIQGFSTVGQGAASAFDTGLGLLGAGLMVL